MCEIALAVRFMLNFSSPSNILQERVHSLGLPVTKFTLTFGRI